MSVVDEVQEAKELIAELCANLYQQGHVSGTGGGISIKVNDKIIMAPSGVQKERMRADDMFVLDSHGEVIHTPEARPPPYKAPKLSECSPLFMSAYELRNAGAVLHGHSINAMLATLIHPDANEFRATHLEMIKGIAHQGFYSNMVVPIIENTARECELTDRLREAMQKYPQSNAVLVRRHGVYVWGDTWIQAKTQFECYDYLFEAAVRMHHLGMDASRAPAPPPLSKIRTLADSNGTKALSSDANKDTTTHNNNNNDNGDDVYHASKRIKTIPQQRQQDSIPTHIVLDIEGTVASLSFVAETLFPYARQRLRTYLEDTFDDEQTQHDIELLRQHAVSDGEANFPPSSSKRKEIIDAAVDLCERHMDADKKTTALKSLQGHIWHQGFENGELKAELYRDVPDALAMWRLQGIKTYIYSSGSRQAQRDLFSHTTVGDLRPYLSGFFDTTSGSKVESTAYDNIALSLGADCAGDILFATDNILEARAAAQAGWRVVVADRPGNKPLPKDCEFKVVESMTDLF